MHGYIKKLKTEALKFLLSEYFFLKHIDILSQDPFLSWTKSLLEDLQIFSAFIRM